MIPQSQTLIKAKWAIAIYNRMWREGIAANVETGSKLIACSVINVAQRLLRTDWREKMKKYYNKEETPLAFHMFFRYVSLPIGFLVTAGSMISEISKIEYFHWLFAVDIGYDIILLALMLVCFIGFFGWKAYAWYGVIAYLCSGVLYSVIIVISYMFYIPDQIGTAVGRFLSFLIYAVLLGIYYRKRKPLFFTDTLKAITETSPDLISQESSNPDTPPQVKFCRKCGYELLPNSVFCSKCGTPIVKE